MTTFLILQKSKKSLKERDIEGWSGEVMECRINESVYLGDSIQ